MNNLYLLVKSFQWDIEFLWLDLPFSDKISFIVKKYFILAKNILFGFTINRSYVRVWGRKHYYNERSGSTYLQCNFIDNSNLKKYLPYNPIIIDVGANVGQFRFFCEYSLKPKKVYSFEPAKATFETLSMNHSTDVYNYAITTKQHLQLFTPGNSTTVASMFQTSATDTAEAVVCKALDDILEIKDEKSIDLLKIDTEGSELDVLKSGINTVKKSKYILVEASVARESSGDIAELVIWLRGVSPQIKVVEIGHSYFKNGKLEAVDLLFCNL